MMEKTNSKAILLKLFLLLFLIVELGGCGKTDEQNRQAVLKILCNKKIAKFADTTGRLFAESDIVPESTLQILREEYMEIINSEECLAYGSKEKIDDLFLSYSTTNVKMRNAFAKLKESIEILNGN
jgi:hypothetical protein